MQLNKLKLKAQKEIKKLKLNFDVLFIVLHRNGSVTPSKDNDIHFTFVINNLSWFLSGIYQRCVFSTGAFSFGEMKSHLSLISLAPL